jgi:hypothetical protein
MRINYTPYLFDFNEIINFVHMNRKQKCGKRKCIFARTVWSVLGGERLNVAEPRWREGCAVI